MAGEGPAVALAEAVVEAPGEVAQPWRAGSGISKEPEPQEEKKGGLLGSLKNIIKK